jgi:DNA-binding MurR/RpiR family transcriptional regulator
MSEPTPAEQGEQEARTRGDRAKHAAPVGPQNFSELAAQLQARMAGFSAGHKRIARQVLTDPEGCAFMTISEMAGAVGVNESTVVRFATRIGLAGYPALTGLCRQYLREQAQNVSRFSRLPDSAGQHQSSSDASKADGVLYPLQATAATDERNIVRSFSRVNRHDWTEAVGACADRRVVYVMGMRKCYSVAHLLSYLLSLVRDDVRHVAAEAGLLPDMLRSIGKNDAFVAISVHRYSLQTVQAMRLAARRGAFAIAFTDNAASPLVEHARVSFYVDTTGASALRSMTALVSLAQALADSVAVKRGTKSRSALLGEEDLLSEFGIYAIGPDYVLGEDDRIE